MKKWQNYIFEASVALDDIIEKISWPLCGYFIGSVVMVIAAFILIKCGIQVDSLAVTANCGMVLALVAWNLILQIISFILDELWMMDLKD